MARKWIVQYKCGCSVGPLPRREILEYCGKHGADIQCKYLIIESVTRKVKAKKKNGITPIALPPS